MGATKLELGSTITTLDRDELRAELAFSTQERERQLARGAKYLRFPPLSGDVAFGALAIDGSAEGIGPREGFLWTIRRITVTGLIAGVTPDAVNLFRNSPTGIPVWQFNGNSPFQTFGKLELVLLGGETLSLANAGVMTATGTVTISGDYMEVSAEQVFKLF